MIQPILKGKGRSNDITVLKLLLKYRSLTISQMTKLDGLEQSYPARRQREKVYRRALHGRKDSSDPGLLMLGLANRDGRMIDRKLTGVYSITERGVRELLTVEVFDRVESDAQKILEGKGIDKIIKVALESGIEPISLIPDVGYLTDEGSGELIEWTWKEFPYNGEFAKFVRWFEERCPQSYREWRAKRLKLDKFLMQADPELIEEVKRNFPLNSKRCGL